MPRSKNNGGLTELQKRFVAAFLLEPNAVRAYVAAGYKSKTPRKEAHSVRNLPAVAAAIQDAMDKRAQKLELSAERVVEEIKHMAFYDPADFVLAVKKQADIAALPESVRRAIVGWKYDKNGRFQILLADKSKALEQLGKHLRLFTEVFEVNEKRVIIRDFTGAADDTADD